jgi:hypothetical protein
MGHHNMGPLYYVLTLALYDFRYNTNQGIRRLGDPNFYHYEHHRLEQLQLIAEEMGYTECKGLALTRDWKRTAGLSFYVSSLSELLKEDTPELLGEDMGNEQSDSAAEIPSYLQDIIAETNGDDRLVLSSQPALELSNEVSLSPSKVLPTERDLAKLMKVDAARIVVAKKLLREEYVLFSNMLANGSYFKGGSLDSIKLSRDWNDISAKGVIPNIRMLVPPIVNALHDTYKRSRQTKAASHSSMPQLDALRETNARKPIEPSLNISFNAVILGRTALKPAKPAPGETHPEVIPAIFRGSFSAEPGAYVSYPEQITSEQDAPGDGEPAAKRKRASRKDALCHTCGLLFSDQEFPHTIIQSRDERTGQLSSGKIVCPVPADHRKSPEEIKKLINEKKRSDPKAKPSGPPSLSSGGSSRSILSPSVTPVGSSISTTNDTSSPFFPVYGIRNDTSKFCYQSPFLQVLFNTLTENDVSLWEKSTRNLLCNTFLAKFHPVLNAYKSNLLISPPSGLAEGPHTEQAHDLLKELRIFFTNCSPTNEFPQNAQGDMGTFFVHMVTALPDFIQDRYCMVQRIINMKGNCFAHTDTASYMLELKFDGTLLSTDQPVHTMCLQKLVFAYTQQEEVLEPSISWKCRNSACETHASTNITSIRLTNIYGRPPILTLRLTRPTDPTNPDLKMNPPIFVTVPDQLRVKPNDQVVYRPFLIAQHLGTHRATGHVVTQIRIDQGVYHIDDSNVSIANDRSLRIAQTNSEMFYFIRCTEYNETLEEFKTPSIQESANDSFCSCFVPDDVNGTTVGEDNGDEDVMHVPMEN